MNPNEAAQIEAIVERVALAVETNIQTREAKRRREAQEQSDAKVRRTIGQVPAWVGVMGMIIGPLVGGGIVYARIDARIEKTADLAKDNERRLDISEDEDRDVAVQLATIKADVAFIKDRVK